MAKDYLSKNTVIEEYDEEWIDLITEAKQFGLSLDEVRTFLNQGNYKERSRSIQNI